MFYTFDKLRSGDSGVFDLYKGGYKLWEEILLNYDGNSTQLASALGGAQLKFEWMAQDLGAQDRWTGQEVMVFTGLTYYLELYDSEKAHLAYSVAEAFQLSYCSIEVKGLAERVSRLFYLEGYRG